MSTTEKTKTEETEQANEKGSYLDRLVSGRCADCAHWKLDIDRHDTICRPVDFDTWLPMEMPFEVRECVNPRLIKFERPLDPDGVSVSDGSDYMARLCTGQEFGCLHFEAR